MAALEKLIENLRQIQQMYAELVDIGEQKKDAIVQNRLNDMSQLVARESKLLKQLAALEQERIHAVSAYQTELGISPNAGSSLAALIRMTVKSEDKQRLDQYRKAILQLADNLKKINETNQMLVRHALDFVGYTLDLLSGGPENDVVYQAPAQQPLTGYAGRRRFFDTKA